MCAVQQKRFLSHRPAFPLPVIERQRARQNEKGRKQKLQAARQELLFLPAGLSHAPMAAARFFCGMWVANLIDFDYHSRSDRFYRGIAPADGNRKAANRPMPLADKKPATERKDRISTAGCAQGDRNRQRPFGAGGGRMNLFGVWPVPVPAGSCPQRDGRADRRACIRPAPA